MRWEWKNEPLDPETATLEDVVAAHEQHARGQSLGTTVGIVAALVIYSTWEGFGYENKWVEYTIFPAIVLGGCFCYRFIYEIITRFRS